MRKLDWRGRVVKKQYNFLKSARLNLGKKRNHALNYLAPIREAFQVYRALFIHAGLDAPKKISHAIFFDSGLESSWSEERFFDLVGGVLLNCFDALGPVYGKAGQILLSRLQGEWKSKAERLRLTRLYGDWPSMAFEEIEEILDSEIPTWRDHFVVSSIPLGVASMAQVHAAQDLKGKRWVIKILKPHAKVRLEQTVKAIEQILKILSPAMELSSSGRRTLKESRELISSLREEANLAAEKVNIDRMRQRLAKKKQTILKIPESYDKFCTRDVLVVECFDGDSLADVVGGKVELSVNVRKKLARRVLNELLVQVFELGLFHGDPHAGNLILLKDGSVGLFDWGLTGELLDSDRRHIAALLKAVMAMDMGRLVNALAQMADDLGSDVSRDDIEDEIKLLSNTIKERNEAGQKLSMQELLESCLLSAEKLQIPVPDGLLMMAKSLLTIEGLARGIDPEIAMARIATPVLFKAAKPGFSDLLAFSKKLPRYASHMIKRPS